MGLQFSKDYHRLVSEGVKLHATMASDTQSLAYHILAAVTKDSDSELQSFLADRSPETFLNYYNSVLSTGYWEEMHLPSSNDNQLKIIDDCAEKFAEDLGRKNISATDLFFACCETIITCRRNQLNPRVDNWIMLSHQEMKSIKGLRRMMEDIKRVSPIGAQFFLISGNSDYMRIFSNNQVDDRYKESKISDDDHKSLSKYATLMNEATFPPFFGREGELQQLRQILAQSRRNNPLLIGEAGVGKTAIVEGLVSLIEKDDLLYPEGHKPQVYSLDIGTLKAGTMYRGQLEERVREIIDIASNNKGNLILFIDEIHMMLSGISSKDIADQLKPALARGDITVIGATTIDEYRQHIEKDPALNRRFETILVNQPDRDMTLKMLMASVHDMEEKHNVGYSNGAIEAAYDLVKRYQPNVSMPDGAFTILDKAGASASLFPTGNRQLIRSQHIAEAISLKTGIPMPQLTQNDDERILSLSDKLKEKVFQQDNAVDVLARAVQSSSAGLRADSKTRGAFLFSGPTGVGKTEAAKVLAETIGAKLIRIDMSEYQDAHSLSKLIGSPPGFVGYNDGGVLSEDVTQNPYSVVLLDEIEKAHPNIYTVLLQTLDNGFLKDGQGRNVDFRNTYIIMTTNAGQAHKKKSGSIGFTAGTEDTETVSTALNNLFAPELRNRLDATVEFSPLGQEGVLKVAGKMLSDVARTLSQNKSITLTFTEAATQQVATGGFDPVMGARPLGRYIENNIYPILGPAILRGAIKKGDHIQVDFKSAAEGDKAEFMYEKLRIHANDDTAQVFQSARLALVQK